MFGSKRGFVLIVLFLVVFSAGAYSSDYVEFTTNCAQDKRIMSFLGDMSQISLTDSHVGKWDEAGAKSYLCWIGDAKTRVCPTGVNGILFILGSGFSHVAPNTYRSGTKVCYGDLSCRFVQNSNCNADEFIIGELGGDGISSHYFRPGSGGNPICCKTAGSVEPPLQPTPPDGGCASDADCSAGERCVNNECETPIAPEPVACLSDSDCGSEKVCFNSRCINRAVGCSFSYECPSGEDCVSGVCEPSQCAKDCRDVACKDKLKEYPGYCSGMLPYDVNCLDIVREGINIATGSFPPLLNDWPGEDEDSDKFVNFCDFDYDNNKKCNFWVTQELLDEYANELTEFIYGAGGSAESSVEPLSGSGAATLSLIGNLECPTCKVQDAVLRVFSLGQLIYQDKDINCEVMTCAKDEDCGSTGRMLGDPKPLKCVEGSCGIPCKTSEECGDLTAIGFTCIGGGCLPRGLFCEDDTNCDEGLVCIEGLCVEKPATCVVDDDCEEWQSCVDGYCRVLSECEGDEDCEEGYECVDGSCHKVEECTPACKEGESCVGGKCVPGGECSNDDKCSVNDDCLDEDGNTGKCLQNGCCDYPSLCDSSSDCDNGEICTAEGCMPFACTDNSECPQDYYCDDNGKCTPQLPPDVCKELGFEYDDVEGGCKWIDCDDDEDCPSGECDDENGVCLPFPDVLCSDFGEAAVACSVDQTCENGIPLNNIADTDICCVTSDEDDEGPVCKDIGTSLDPNLQSGNYQEGPCIESPPGSGKGTKTITFVPTGDSSPGSPQYEPCDVISPGKGRIPNSFFGLFSFLLAIGIIAGYYACGLQHKL